MTPPEWIETAARMRRLLDEIERPIDQVIDQVIAVTIDTYLPALARLDCE